MCRVLIHIQIVRSRLHMVYQGGEDIPCLDKYGIFSFKIRLWICNDSFQQLLHYVAHDISCCWIYFEYFWRISMISFVALNVKGCVACSNTERGTWCYFVSVLKLVSIALWCFLSI